MIRADAKDQEVKVAVDNYFASYIRVYDADDTAAIVDYLMKNGHVVNEIKKNKIGLEEYYIELMSKKEDK